MCSEFHLPVPCIFLLFLPLPEEMLCLFVCLSVCLSVCTELSCFSPQLLVGWRRNFHQRSEYSCRVSNWSLWCHTSRGVAAMLEKLWTSVSLKPQGGKKLNLAHGKHTSWGISVIFKWCHNCIWRTLHLISMKIFVRHLWIKFSTEKKFDVAIGHVIRQPYCFLKKSKIFLWSGSTDPGETLHVRLPVHEEQKIHAYYVIGHMVWQPYWIECSA